MNLKLENKLQQIYNEKQNNLLPQYIKAGHMVFGIKGNYTRSANATSNRILNGYTAYVNANLIVGNMPNNGNLSYNPTTEVQNIPEGYITGGTINAVTSSIDSNIQAGNIKSGINILNIQGTFTSDANANVSDILVNKTAYVNGIKLIGTMPDNGTLNYVPDDNPQTIPAGYTSGGTVSAIDITVTQEYKRCDALADAIIGDPSQPYRKIEYIKGTGTQWIDLGVPAGTSTSIEIDAAVHIVNNKTSIMGSWGTNRDTTRWNIYFHNTASRLYFYIGASNNSWDWASNKDVRMIYKMDHNKLYINGTLKQDFTSVGTINSGTNAFLFTAESDGSDACTMTLYKCKVWVNDVLIKELIPVRRGNDNAICLYDTINHEYYLNQGTDNFIPGDIIDDEEEGE